MSKLTSTQIDDLVERTKDAYSFDRYSSWKACVRLLNKRGYSEIEIEAVLRSKWMRWAGDRSTNEYGQVTSGDLARFLDDPQNRCNVKDILD